MPLCLCSLWLLGCLNWWACFIPIENISAHTSMHKIFLVFSYQKYKQPRFYFKMKISELLIKKKYCICNLFCSIMFNSTQTKRHWSCSFERQSANARDTPAAKHIYKISHMSTSTQNIESFSCLVNTLPSWRQQKKKSLAKETTTN